MKYLFLLGCSLLVVAPAAAQEANDDIIIADPIRDDLITVVATGLRSRVEQSGQSVSVIGADEIASIQGPDLTRVLTRLPGVTLTRNGSLGSFTGVRVRGSDAEQLLVLVDGVRVNDPSSPGGGFDFGNLLSSGIGKIELLRGSNSVVWGSQAIGGVLAVTSKDLDGAEGSVEYGAHDSLDASANAGLVGGRYAISLNAGYTRTDGISSAASGTEPDGFRQWRIGGRGSLELAEGFSANLTGRYADSLIQLDGYPAPLYSFADTPEFQKTREVSGRAGLAYQAEGWQLGTGYALSDTRRVYFDPAYGTAPSYGYKGRSERADVSGKVDLARNFGLIVGADSEWSRFSSDFDAEKQARLSSTHALLSYDDDRLNLAAGLRLDDHSRFGSEWSFGANGSFAIADGWRIRASYGEGFKAPTLFQLYSAYGDPALNLERSRSYDFALEKGDRNGAIHFALTAFRRDSRELIDFDFGSFSYKNIGAARAEGIEVEMDARASATLGFHAAYSFTKAANRASGNDLARRPRHALTLSGDWQTPLHSLTLGADLRVVSDSYDDAGNISRLDGYALVTLRASLPVTEQVELFARIENVTNTNYQTVAGYGTAGRSAYAGFRARF
jgi:vitamin B12 transporter